MVSLGPLVRLCRPRSARAIAGATLAAITLVGCASETVPASPSGQQSATQAAPASTLAAPNAADVMFAQMMIPHHEQAVVMAEILLEQPGMDAPVTDLAQRIIAAQGPEITQLRGWLAEWGENPTPDAGGMHHDGTGMSESDMEDLRSASGDRARDLFLTGMIEHHRGAITMAQAELEQGRHKGARRLAEEIIAAQEAEIAEMTVLLDTP